MITTDFAIQTFRWEHAPGAVKLINTVRAADHEEGMVTEDEFHARYGSPEIDAEKDLFVALAPDGEVVGFASAFFYRDDGVSWAGLRIHPQWRGLGIESRLLQASDAHTLEIGESYCPPEQPIYIQRELDSESPMRPFLEAEGYRHIRSTYTMQRPLTAPVQPAPLPENVFLRPFVKERDAEAVHECMMEAFRDHWGYIYTPYESWAVEVFNTDKYDPELWLCAVDPASDKIVGFSFGIRWGDDQPDAGYVSELCVRRPWRKQGLGMALLERLFQLFQERGYQQVKLHVDASNTTNALALYQRAGMRVERQHVVYRKVLRGSEADIRE